MGEVVVSGRFGLEIVTGFRCLVYLAGHLPFRVHPKATGYFVA
jgi:hypothetical protein